MVNFIDILVSLCQSLNNDENIHLVYTKGITVEK